MASNGSVSPARPRFAVFAILRSLMLALVLLGFAGLLGAAAVAGWVGSGRGDSDINAQIDTLTAEFAKTYRQEGMDGLIAAIRSRSSDANSALIFLSDAKGRWIAGNLANRPRQVATSATGFHFDYNRNLGGTLEQGGALGRTFNLAGGHQLLIAIGEQQQVYALALPWLVGAAGAFASFALLCLILSSFTGSGNPLPPASWESRSAEFLRKQYRTFVRIVRLPAAKILTVTILGLAGAGFVLAYLALADEDSASREPDAAPVSTAMIDKDGSTLVATAGFDGTARIYRGSALIGTVRGHAAPVTQVAFVANGDAVITTDATGLVQVTQVRSLAAAGAFDPEPVLDRLRAALWDPFGRPIASSWLSLLRSATHFLPMLRYAIPPAADMQKDWQGVYLYGVRDLMPVAFDMHIDIANNRFEGQTYNEMYPNPQTEQQARISDGKINGHAISWTKTYDAKHGMSNSVEYKGELSSDYSEISGTWVTGGASGQFYLRIHG